jgi:hypothetical protein
MFTPVSDEQQVGVAERRAAVSALARSVEPARLDRLPRLPVCALQRPRHDVLEPAEHRAAVPSVFGEPVAVARLDRIAAPGASQGFRF